MLSNLNSHFQPSNTAMNTRKGLTPKSDDDVVIVSMARTAMTRAKKGNQRNTAPEAMLAPVMRDVIKKAGIDAKKIQEICIGNVLQPGAGSTSSRMAQFLADIPETTPLYAVDRLCSSGLQAVMNVA